jgi:hypothetical protein
MKKEMKKEMKTYEWGDYRNYEIGDKFIIYETDLDRFLKNRTDELHYFKVNSEGIVVEKIA